MKDRGKGTVCYFEVHRIPRTRTLRDFTALVAAAAGAASAAFRAFLRGGVAGASDEESSLSEDEEDESSLDDESPLLSSDELEEEVPAAGMVQLSLREFCCAQTMTHTQLLYKLPSCHQHDFAELTKGVLPSLALQRQSGKKLRTPQ